MDSTVVAELAWAVTRAGHASLRFNYQGVGASQGTIAAPAALERLDARAPLSVLDSEVGDCDAAVRHLAESVAHGKVALAGYSFGAAVALRHALEHPEIQAIVLVAPPTTLFDFSALAGFDRRLLVVAAHQDPLTDRPKVSEWVQAAANGRFDVIPGADHSFTRGLTELGRRVAAFLASP
jgi:alpha/beta superfamily hydrolase